MFCRAPISPFSAASSSGRAGRNFFPSSAVVAVCIARRPLRAWEPARRSRRCPAANSAVAACSSLSYLASRFAAGVIDRLFSLECERAIQIVALPGDQFLERNRAAIARAFPFDKLIVLLEWKDVDEPQVRYDSVRLRGKVVLDERVVGDRPLVVEWVLLEVQRLEGCLPGAADP